MGCTQSHSEIPRPPYYLQKDPQAFDALTIHIAKIQNHEDYGIWRNLLPETYAQQKETIWLWCNRVVNEEEQTIQIDLENFKRGTIEDMPDKGRVLFNVTLPQSFPYLFVQRFANDTSDTEVYRGLLQGPSGEELYANESDDFYVSHPSHRRKLQAHITGKLLTDCIITKWMSKQQYHLEDGTEGRNIAIFGEDVHPVLEVQVRGTMVTSYVEEPSIVKEIEHTIKKKESRYSISMPEMTPVFENVIEKLQTEFVDIVEFRLLAPSPAVKKDGESPTPEESQAPKVLAEWAIRGDSYHHTENKEIAFQTPLFNLTLPCGWLNLYDFQVQIKGTPNIDTAMTMLIAYLHGTEFSVGRLKQAVVIETPSKPPSTAGDGILASNEGGVFGLPPDEIVGGAASTKVEEFYMDIKENSTSNDIDIDLEKIRGLDAEDTTNAVANLEVHYDGEVDEKLAE